jgi:hypothetical protein
MHVFDIRRSNSVTKLWKSFETTPGRGPGCPRPHGSQVHPQLGKSEVKIMDFRHGAGGVSDAADELHPDDLRKAWLKACNPPQAMPKGTFSRQGESAVSAAAGSSPSVNESATNNSSFAFTIPLKPGPSSLTAEGRRQVSSHLPCLRNRLLTPIRHKKQGPVYVHREISSLGPVRA